MLLNLILIIILAWSFMLGYSRGFILQVFYTFGTIIAAIIAAFNYKSLAKGISQWIPFSSPTESSKLLLFNQKLLFHLDDAFYAGVAFIIIFLISYLVIRLIGLFLHFSQTPFAKNGKIAAGILGLCATYFAFQMIFTTLSLVPMDSLQNTINGSFIARFMVLHTPISSQALLNLFIESITKIKPIA